ncbi:septum formation inhibitor Maf [Aquimarina sp. 2201CG5-10]|uniref:septum formation inhibitor Maf n=1 Tax=Aquimarina callyspongiae TaxID=3098150 RepID=UPI002AB3501D|nr:septum formation inhibitor Maf [Aquimarina sp. 2201CG5-10]MDY8136395.1 septum formation inhibitor Maf [Aquimarina sp. 2201CG5-10]
MKKLLGIIGILGVLMIIACSNIKENNNEKIASNTIAKETKEPAKQISEEFKKYWYAGEAEISSYQLEQARYGEIRKGTAVLIYVTEDFLPKEQVKADSQNTDNVPVLKLNATKKFNTGIYPYSIMQSTFYPVANNQHAIKVSSSMQEWCGHVYAQLNNRKQFEILSHSYFQGEADQEFKLNKAILENELWTKIRINPNELPQGELKIIPSFEYCRLRHKEIKAYTAIVSLLKKDNSNTYTIEYPELKRKVNITFNASFPYEIESWTETFKSGFGPNAKELTTKATRIKSIKSAYWGKNSNTDETLREELGLK